MANINDVYAGGGRYLKVADLQGREPIVRIDHVGVELVGRAREEKLVVYFVGKEKGLKLNVTLARQIATIANSPETEDWPGVVLQLYPATAEYGGARYDVVRVRAPQRSAPRAAPPPAVIAPPTPRPNGSARASAPITEEDIPF
jgi:hypothetical protein